MTGMIFSQTPWMRGFRMGLISGTQTLRQARIFDKSFSAGVNKSIIVRYDHGPDVARGYLIKACRSSIRTFAGPFEGKPQDLELGTTDLSFPGINGRLVLDVHGLSRKASSDPYIFNFCIRSKDHNRSYPVIEGVIEFGRVCLKFPERSIDR